MAKQPDPWERLESESSKAYEAFCIYRDLGINRSIAKVVQILGKSKALLEGWSSKHDWVERAAAWDSEQDRVARQQQLDDIKKMRKRHASLAEAMLLKASKALLIIPEDEIKAGDVSRMVDIASKLERISRGDVGDVIEERDGGEAIDPVQIYIPDNNRGRTQDEFDDLEV